MEGATKLPETHFTVNLVETIIFLNDTCFSNN